MSMNTKSMTDMLLEQLMSAQQSGGASSALGLGGDSVQVQSGLAAAIPAIIGALTKNTQSEKGAEALDKALTKDHDGSVLDNLGSYMQNPDLQDGEGILKHAFGKNQDGVENQLSKSTGLDPKMIATLLKFAAPLILGMLAKQKRASNLSANQLAGVLDQETQLNAQAQPGLQATLNSLLDQNEDGSFMDEVQGMVGKLLNRKPENED